MFRGEQSEDRERVRCPDENGLMTRAKCGTTEAQISLRPQGDQRNPGLPDETPRFVEDFSGNQYVWRGLLPAATSWPNRWLFQSMMLTESLATCWRYDRGFGLRVESPAAQLGARSKGAAALPKWKTDRRLSGMERGSISSRMVGSGWLGAVAGQCRWLSFTAVAGGSADSGSALICNTRFRRRRSVERLPSDLSAGYQS